MGSGSIRSRCAHQDTNILCPLSTPILPSRLVGERPDSGHWTDLRPSRWIVHSLVIRAGALLDRGAWTSIREVVLGEAFLSAPDIFLSYNRDDQAVAKRYANAFAAEGLEVRWDTALRSGEAYDEVTEAALRGAKALVVLWSPRSVVSRWLRADSHRLPAPLSGLPPVLAREGSAHLLDWHARVHNWALQVGRNRLSRIGPRPARMECFR